MNLLRGFVWSFCVVGVVACGGKNEKMQLADGATGDMEAYVSSDVNAIVQAKPEIMVIPSDQLLKSSNCLRTRKVDGQSYTIRNYQKFLLENSDFKTIVSEIQNAFGNAGFPLNDFEQTLKNLDNQYAEDIADNLAQDAKTRLLQAAAPDIILELTYETKADYSKGNNPEKTVNYLLNGIDAYTNKAIVNVSSDGVTGKDLAQIMSKDLVTKLPVLMDEIQETFNDILTRGREITVRVNVAAGSNQNLYDENIEGDTYADVIIDYIKVNTVKGAYKLQVNTANQLSFTNVRINILNDNGTQYGVYDWTRDLQKYLKRNLGLNCENRSQGLGEVVLTIKGM